MSNAAARNQISRINRADNGLNHAQFRIVRALANRWDGELADDVVANAAVSLDAAGPQWALKIEKGYFLDVVREHIAAAQAA